MASRCSRDRDLRPEGRSYLKIGFQRLSGFDLSVAPAFRPEILALSVALLLGVSVIAQAPDRAQTEALARRAAERLAALQKEAESLANQERGVLAELRKLELDRAIKVEELTAIERDARGVQDKIAAAGTRAEQHGDRDERNPRTAACHRCRLES